MPGGPPGLGARFLALLFDYVVVVGPVFLVAVVNAAMGGRQLPIWVSALLSLWMLATVIGLSSCRSGSGGPHSASGSS